MAENCRKISKEKKDKKGKIRSVLQNFIFNCFYLHLSLSVAVARLGAVRLVLEAAQVNTAPWSRLVTEP